MAGYVEWFLLNLNYNFHTAIRCLGKILLVKNAISLSFKKFKYRVIHIYFNSFVSIKVDGAFRLS